MREIAYKQKIRVRTLSNRHVSDDPFDGILPLVAILAVKVCPKLKVFTCLRVSVIDRIEEGIQPNLSWAQP